MAEAAQPSATGDGLVLDATHCYPALESRDPRFDGRFFVGVATTGIYCRPVCPAPTPKAANVRFFACAAAAEDAGFRPCLRCRPETSPGTPAWLGSSAVVSRALRLIGDGALDGSDVESLAERVGIGARQLRRLFDTHLGASPSAIARARRVHFARRLLDESDLSMTRVAFAAGFASVRQFNHAMRSTFHASPRELRAKRRVRSRPSRANSACSSADDALTLRLPYRAPHDWDALLGFLALRATPGVERIAGRSYLRTIERAGGSVIELRPGPAEQHFAELVVHAGESEDLLCVVERARRILDLGADPHAIASHLAQDPLLAPLVAARPGLRVPGAWDGFELAVRAVLGQQVTVRGATTLAGRLVREFGTRLEQPVAELTHRFPRPEVLAEADLRGVGLPAARAATISRLAAEVSRGSLRLDGSGELDTTIDALCALDGIGPWTAHYVAMRALREPDAFPAGDLALRKALPPAADGKPPSERVLAARAEAWRPWRAYAALHLWSSLA